MMVNRHRKVMSLTSFCHNRPPHHAARIVTVQALTIVSPGFKSMPISAACAILAVEACHPSWSCLINSDLGNVFRTPSTSTVTVSTVFGTSGVICFTTFAAFSTGFNALGASETNLSASSLTGILTFLRRHGSHIGGKRHRGAGRGEEIRGYNDGQPVYLRLPAPVPVSSAYL